MRDIKVASRYAKSLLGIALEQNTLEEVYHDMQMISNVCAQNRDLVLLLKSPIVRRDKKEAIFTEIFGNNISIISNTFFSIILTKKREGLLPDIASSFIDVYKTYKNITTTYITTAIPLTEEQKLKIIALLKNQGNKNIELIEKINSGLIGGLIIKIGDKQVDESIKRKLSNLEKEFDENPFVREY
ncbi:MAG: ATP synthase F1 subunit delta [Bacteroidetes bacterium RIFCSPLOWO2_12_FULL_31_6]|nr:MAG: ATP synthase F1 subunit delta [Bacteroidetes bacterium RIFCSPLOWO2_12_FULL_31_6]